MSTPTTPHPQVPHPRVPISRKTSVMFIARCHHCDWSMESTAKAACEEYARYHRHQHRTGQIPVT